MVISWLRLGTEQWGHNQGAPSVTAHFSWPIISWFLCIFFLLGHCQSLSSTQMSIILLCCSLLHSFLPHGNQLHYLTSLCLLSCWTLRTTSYLPAPAILVPVPWYACAILPVIAWRFQWLQSKVQRRQVNIECHQYLISSLQTGTFVVCLTTRLLIYKKKIIIHFCAVFPLWPQNKGVA